MQDVTVITNKREFICFSDDELHFSYCVFTSIPLPPSSISCARTHIIECCSTVLDSVEQIWCRVVEMPWRTFVRNQCDRSCIFQFQSFEAPVALNSSQGTVMTEGRSNRKFFVGRKRGSATISTLTSQIHRTRQDTGSVRLCGSVLVFLEFIKR